MEKKQYFYIRAMIDQRFSILFVCPVCLSVPTDNFKAAHLKMCVTFLIKNFKKKFNS
jgi:hypothetical protein